MKHPLLLGLVLSANAFILCTPLAAQAQIRTWMTPDFFIETDADGRMGHAGNREDGDAASGKDGESALREGLVLGDCRAHIADVMCVGVDDTFNLDATSSAGCDETNAPKYVSFFEAVYDRLPPAMQQMFCSVKTLRVEPGLPSIAYAGMRYHGAEVGFRKSVIDEGLDLSTLMSWKEQLPFGGERDVYEPVATLPTITVQSAQVPVQDLAFYVLAHEFGHLFDFANNINRISLGLATPGSWTALSWTSSRSVRRDQDFPGRAKVCYYDCAGRPLGKAAIAPLYQGLDKSNFITLYAATNIYDDFADSLAMTLMAQDETASYTLADGQGAVYDAHEKLQSKQFAKKAAYIANFLARTDLDYP